MSANFDGGYRWTQFYRHQYNTGIAEGDGRIEFWLPPGRDKFAIGPYIRVAGIGGSEPNAFENGWLARPGVGIQMYPFPSFLGPVRVFAEYNFSRYWGEDFPGQGTSWRPQNQARAGFDYWKAKYVNCPCHFWWMELWNGAYWQSANEFTYRYDSPVVANSLRLGIRPVRALSTITPYLTLQSSWSKYERTGAGPKHCFLSSQNSQDPANPCDFFWENRLLVGGGVRYAPSLGKCDPEKRKFLNRLVLYGEYVNTATYYGPTAPSQFPRFDALGGLSVSFGHWYK